MNNESLTAPGKVLTAGYGIEANATGMNLARMEFERDAPMENRSNGSSRLMSGPASRLIWAL